MKKKIDLRPQSFISVKKYLQRSFLLDKVHYYSKNDNGVLITGG